MTLLFPDEYLHIGGDEVTYKHWKQNPRIHAFIQQQNLRDEPGLQAYFNKRVLPILN
jgi:hexosaminidase